MKKDIYQTYVELSNIPQQLKERAKLREDADRAAIQMANKSWAERNPFFFAFITAVISTSLGIVAQKLLEIL